MEVLAVKSNWSFLTTRMQRCPKMPQDAPRLGSLKFKACRQMALALQDVHIMLSSAWNMLKYVPYLVAKHWPREKNVRLLRSICRAACVSKLRVFTSSHGCTELPEPSWICALSAASLCWHIDMTGFVSRNIRKQCCIHEPFGELWLCRVWWPSRNHSCQLQAEMQKMKAKLQLDHHWCWVVSIVISSNA